LGGGFNHYLILLEKMGSIPKSTGLFSLPKKTTKTWSVGITTVQKNPSQKLPLTAIIDGVGLVKSKF
jgi:hypothetical protein